MIIHQFHHIAPAKVVVGDVAVQNGIGVKFKGHDWSLLAGTKVTNFVRPDNRSFIQTVLTDKLRPLGPVRTEEMA